MAFKIFTKGRYFYIVDTSDNREYEALKTNVKVSRGLTTSTIFYFDGIESWATTRGLDITDIQDITGASYTLNDFVKFYEEIKDPSSNNYIYEIALGDVVGSSNVNKFGFNQDIDSASSEIIASFGGTFPITNIITGTAETLTITYNNATDGLGTTGALSLLITYLDENYLEVQAFHTLGNTGSDISSFTTFGVNRVVVLSNGGDGFNVNNIDLTATTLGSIQARVPATSSVTQQCILHTQIGFSFLLDFFTVNVLKLSGGSAPRVTIQGFSYSRFTNTRYEVFDFDIDTSVQNTKTLNFTNTIKFDGREVIYFVATTNTNNTKVNLRFGGVTIKN